MLRAPRGKGLEIQQIGSPLQGRGGGQTARLVWIDGVVVGRIVNRSPYPPEGAIDPTLTEYEPQRFVDGSFEVGPLFGWEGDAIEFLTG